MVCWASPQVGTEIMRIDGVFFPLRNTFALLSKNITLFHYFLKVQCECYFSNGSPRNVLSLVSASTAFVLRKNKQLVADLMWAHTKTPGGRKRWGFFPSIARAGALLSKCQNLRK